eukprot:2397669-Pyramimonas_sp.AAC.1
MHMVDRVITVQGAASDVIQISTSILAGCVQSVAWNPAHLHDMLRETHARYLPRGLMQEPHRGLRPLEVQTWVDDTALQVLGNARDVVRQCSEALIHLFRRMQGQELRISGKTVLLASQPKLVQQIAANVQA